ncbi:hypothetical protein Shyhy02_79400 [Streptomyces hygroscopicus subsp. hygroscopicus]|nr:hypothetical protein Shyhy02_79400 [Streptomyces hygroscopicus subsp. hygroscopicus]
MVKGKRRKLAGNSWLDKGCFPPDGWNPRRHTWSKGVQRVHRIRSTVTLRMHAREERAGVAATPARIMRAPAQWAKVRGIVGTRTGAPDAPHRAHRIPGCPALPHRTGAPTAKSTRRAPSWSPLSE